MSTSNPVSALLTRHAWLWAAPTLLLILLALTAMKPAPDQLQRALDRNELIVVTRLDPLAYYQDHHGNTGFDYELARRFAAFLGVKLKVITADTINEVYQLLADGKADMAAAALANDADRLTSFYYSNALIPTGKTLIYRTGTPRPTSLADIEGLSVAALAGSASASFLKQQRQTGLALNIKEIQTANSTTLITLVSEGVVDAALVNSQGFDMQRSLFPQIRSAFDIDEDAMELAWVIRRQGEDNSLKQAINHFIALSQEDGTVKTLAAQFLGQHNPFNLYTAHVFIDHLNNRLPQFAHDFYQASTDTRIDWRLLAAMGYQESHWNPDAESPTGVRGLMMLTRKTAHALGVDREDPVQSIEGGSRYLKQLIDRLPPRIKQYDRTWMAIAAYNVGMGHLEDTRVLTQALGGDPDKWEDVRQNLPLLSQPAYADYLKHGRADGKQALRYVTRIHNYYKLLVWADSGINGQSTLLLAAN